MPTSALWERRQADEDLEASLGYIPYLKKEKERMRNNLPPPGFSQSTHHLLGLDRHVLRDKYQFVVVHWFLASGRTTGLCGLAAAPEVQG